MSRESSLQLSTPSIAAIPRQSAFNKLVSQLEHARLKFERTKQMLDLKNAYAGSYIRPALDRKMELYMNCLEIYFEECQRTKAKKRRELLARFIIREIDPLLMMPFGIREQYIVRVKEMAKVCEDIAFGVDAGEEDDFKELEKLFFDNMMSDVKSRFEEMGVDVDLSEITPDLSQEEVEARLRRLIADANAEAQKKIKPKKMTSKEKEREQKQLQKEEARKKSIGSIYKALAKVLHPDLETNSAERSRKEESMKKLTLAYKGNDLYALLLLEQEWMNCGESHLHAMSEDQLKIYSEVFREQIMEIRQKEDLLVYRPDYAFIRGFVENPYRLKQWKPEIEKKEIESRIFTLELDIKQMTRSKGERKALIDLKLRYFKEYELEEDSAFLDFMDF